MYSIKDLPQRHEYIVGGFNGIEHIVVNYNKDGTVVRTVNGKDKLYSNQEEFRLECEKHYQEYVDCFLHNPQQNLWNFIKEGVFVILASLIAIFILLILFPFMITSKLTKSFVKKSDL